MSGFHIKCDLHSEIKEVKRNHLCASPDVGCSQQRLQAASRNMLRYLKEIKFKELKYDDNESTNRNSQ